MAMAMEDPDLQLGEHFGLRVNWGSFEGENAMAVSAMGVVGRNVFRAGDRIAVGAALGYGLSEHNLGGRVGVQMTWR